MHIAYQYNYNGLDDQKLVELILDGNEEALLYLIFDRYSPLLKKLCVRYYADLYFLEQLQTELLILLKTKDFHALRGFGWRSSFGTWLGVVAGNLFIKKMPELIGISKFTVSIGEDGDNNEVNPSEPESPHENDIHMVLLIEAIHLLEDKDMRYILLREFDGYKPKEIAKQLENYRRREGRLKSKKVNGESIDILPTAEYMHMLKGRAKDEIRVIIKELKKEFKW
ncbi:MAG: hypothetical protein IJ190_05525 [Prevotella sp.]|nr:hypothetical protein [Prevotella sp.]